MWPIAQRDFLINQQLVRLKDKAWLVAHSVEDDDNFPPTPPMERMHIEHNMIFMKPVSQIKGYKVMIENQFDFGGNLPLSIVSSQGIK